MAPLAPQADSALHCCVTSKKGVIGIGVPLHLCDASRRLFRRAPAACSFVPPVFGGSNREPQGSPVLARGARYANLFELPPSIGVGGGGCSKPHLLEATMADRIPARALAARTVSPTTSPALGTLDPIQLHAAAHNALSIALHHLRQPQLDVASARRKVAQALAALHGLDMALSLEG